MLEQLLTPDFLIFFAVVASATGVILWRLSKSTIAGATPVEIVAVNGRKLEPKLHVDSEKEELKQKISELEEKFETLKIINDLQPEETGKQNQEDTILDEETTKEIDKMLTTSTPPPEQPQDPRSKPSAKKKNRAAKQEEEVNEENN